MPGWQLPAGSQHPAQTPRPHELEEPPILHAPPSDPPDASLDEDPPEELPEPCEHVPLPRQIAPTAVQSEHLLPPMPHALSFTPGTQVPVPSQQPLHDGPHVPPLSSPPVAFAPPRAGRPDGPRRQEYDGRDYAELGKADPSRHHHHVPVFGSLHTIQVPKRRANQAGA